MQRTNSRWQTPCSSNWSTAFHTCPSHCTVWASQWVNEYVRMMTMVMFASLPYHFHHSHNSHCEWRAVLLLLALSLNSFFYFFLPIHSNRFALSLHCRSFLLASKFFVLLHISNWDGIFFFLVSFHSMPCACLLFFFFVLFCCSAAHLLAACPALASSIWFTYATAQKCSWRAMLVCVCRRV